MFFPGRDNPSLNMMNASFTEEDTLCGRGLCISTGKHVLRGGWWNSVELLAISRGFGGFGDCYRSQTSLAMEVSQAEGEGPAHPSWVWSSPSPSWGYSTRAFLSRDLFWQRNLGPVWRSHNWDLSLSFPVPLLRGAPDGLLVSALSPAGWTPHF